MAVVGLGFKPEMFLRTLTMWERVRYTDARHDRSHSNAGPGEGILLDPVYFGKGWRGYRSDSKRCVSTRPECGVCAYGRVSGSFRLHHRFQTVAGDAAADVCPMSAKIIRWWGSSAAWALMRPST
ncbi:MAG: hypothetical protein Ct9H300mP14_10510 [Gammaproteobacteria bacterium]|nr:MAG: hypothetical protein Ct9H300mP14_10510 [Gammaproteobacteria bacterium]